MSVGHRREAWLIAGLLAVYLMLAAVLPAADDEVYYWSWARPLQFSYYDHPPLTAYMIRLSTRSLAQVGRASGMIIAVSTVGSIVGVFVSGFVLIEHMNVPNIFRVMGGLTIVLGVLCVILDRWMVGPNAVASSTNKSNA